MMKKLLVAMLVFVLVLAAFSGNGAIAAKKITIRILTRDTGDRPEGAAVKEVYQKFLKENPDIEIQDESVNSADGVVFNDKFKTAIATGNLPDMFLNYGGAPIKEYVKNKLFMNLAPVFKADPAWYKSFLPIFDMWQFDGIKGTYGVPRGYFTVGIYYNKDLFKKYGVQPPATIEDFEKAADVFLKNGVTPLALGEKDYWRGAHLATSLSMKKYGFKLTKDLGTRKKKYTGPEIVSIFKLMTDWQKKGYFGQNIVSTDYSREKAMFCSGESAMHMDGNWFMSDTAKEPLMIENKIGFIPFPYFKDKPQFKGGAMGGPNGGYSIAGTSDKAHQTAAVKLLKYLMSEKSLRYIQTKAPGELYGVKFTPDPASTTPIVLNYIDVANKLTDLKQEIDCYDPLKSMEDRFRYSIQGMFAGNTPEQAAQEIQAEIDRNQ